MDDDPMVFLRQQREKLAAMAEMASVAQAQEAVAMNVQARMQKIEALLHGGGTVESTVPSSISSSRSSSKVTQSTAGMTGDEEVDYWKRKIAILSQPVTAEGLAPPGTVPPVSYNNTTANTFYNKSFSSPSSSPSSSRTNTSYATSSFSDFASPSRRHQLPPQQYQQNNQRQYQQPQQPQQRRQQSNQNNRQSQRSPATSVSGVSYGHKVGEQQERAYQNRSPGRRGYPKQSPARKTPTKKKHHHGEPVDLCPEGFPPTPPGWKRARDTKSGRYYLYRGSETTWETDRHGRRYKK